MASATWLILLTITVGYLVGCSAGYPEKTSPGTTYVITVTGTSGTDVRSTTVTLIVQ
jgi:hypothetical protein